MAITTIAELEQAREALAGRTAAELADFILSLASASDGISEYVHAFALAADTHAVTGVLTSELQCLRNAERDRDYRHRKGAGHVDRAERWLDAVERCILPRDAQAALQLLSAFMESSEQISAHCWDDDFGASELSTRASTMAGNLARTMTISTSKRLQGGSEAPDGAKSRR